MPTRLEWTFEPVGPMGGATGDAFVNTLQAGGIPPEAALAREAVQNSCDAAKGHGHRVRVVFRIVTLEDDARVQLIEQLALRKGIEERIGALNLAPNNCLTSSAPLRLLFVEDYGTVGLHGDPHDWRSHFYRLLLSVGDSTKAFEQSGSGGSYGYGKSALSLNSRIRTIVAYSAFEPDCTGATARLMACTYLGAHEFDNRRWTGRGWFGVRREGAEVVVDPLQDVEAHDFAARLGFMDRRNGDHFAPPLGLRRV